MERTNREKLKLVFALKTDSGKKTVITEKPRIEVGQRRHGALKAIDALEIILEVLRTLGLEETFQIHGTSIELQRLLTLARNTNQFPRIETPSLSFSYGTVASCEHCFIEITEKVPGGGDWERWTAPFVILPHFVQAWIADVEYDKWQNAEDLLMYKAANRDHSSLPLRSNGLPPPLEQMVVDISQNPGRWKLRSGYVEAVGSVMWLSDLFWQYVGIDHKERLACFSQARIKQVTDEVIRITVAETSFNDPSNRDLQDRLRETLYR